MTVTSPAPERPDYPGLGFAANPFPPMDGSSEDAYWMRLVTHAASGALLSGVMRASAGERTRPVVVTMTEDVPDYYYRASQNAFLSRAAQDAALGLMALNVPLEMMRLGEIRGTLTEVAELVAAVDLPLTVGEFFADVLGSPDTELPEFAALAPGQLDEALSAFRVDAGAATQRFLGGRAALAKAGPTTDEDDALHQVYLRQTTLEVSPDQEQEARTGEDPEIDEGSGRNEAPAGHDGADDGVAAGPAPDDVMRDYLLAYVRHDLSPVVARALEAYAEWGESIVAQELKVTKAPRKTLAAVLRLMASRWKRVVVLYDRFDAWPVLEQQARMDVLAALTELRWIIGAHGVMGVVVTKGLAVEVEEQFAAGEQIDWSLPELTRLYNGDFSFDAGLVQRWLDAAAISGVAPIRADGDELAPLVSACENDILHFALMAQAAFSNAAERGSRELDAEAISAGLASATVGDGV